MLSNCSVKKMLGWGFAYMSTFAFHASSLPCLHFGMPSLHLFTYLMFFIFLFLYFFDVNLKIDVNLSYS